MNQEAISIIRPANAMWIVILALSVLPLHTAGQSSGSVTVTFYRPQPTALGNPISSCDHNKSKIVVYSDGQKLLRIQKGNFLVLRLPVGHHAFKSTRSKQMNIDLKAGGQYFLRPRQTCGGAFLAQEALELVTCEEATTEAKQLVPLNAEDIYADKSLVEKLSHITTTCKARPVF
jgi:hypothetical protein